MRLLPSALLFATLAVLAVLAVPAALAHPHADPAPQRRFMLTPTEARQVYGTYALSNGDLLEVSGTGRQHWAEMSHTGRIEIVPVDWYVFVEKGGFMRFTFTPFGFAAEVTIDGLAERGVPVVAGR